MHTKVPVEAGRVKWRRQQERQMPASVEPAWGETHPGNDSICLAAQGVGSGHGRRWTMDRDTTGTTALVYCATQALEAAHRTMTMSEIEGRQESYLPDVHARRGQLGKDIPLGKTREQPHTTPPRA